MNISLHPKNLRNVHVTQDLSTYSTTVQGDVLVDDVRGRRTLNSNSVVGADLSKGYVRNVFQLQRDIFLNSNFLQVLRQKDLIADVPVLTLRRVLLKLILVPYKRQKCRFTITYHSDRILLDYDSDDISEITPLQHTGKQFEKAILSGSDEFSGFHSVCSHDIDDIKVLFAAEMDAFSPNSGYIELKTQSETVSKESFVSFLVSVWCQCKLAGVQHIIVGTRTRSKQGRFRVKKCTRYTTDSIPQLISSRKYRSAVDLSGLWQWYGHIIDAIVRAKPDGETTEKFNLVYDPDSNTSHMMLNKKD